VKQIISFAAMALLCARALAATEGPMAEIRERFRSQDRPVLMEYRLGYRFLNMELSQLGKIHMSTTTGLWRHRITGKEIPVVAIDVRVDSMDAGKEGERNRISIHDQMVSILTLPDLEALLFAKVTDENLNPLFGRRSVTQAISVYDTQSGHVECTRYGFDGQSARVPLSRPDDLLELSRQIRPIMNFLVGQYRGKKADIADKDRISVNLDGQVVNLKLVTHKERSPVCLNRERLDSLCIETVPLGKKQARARDFFAWAVPFDQLADLLDNDLLRGAAQKALVESVTPLVVDYDLAIGRIRASLVSATLDETVVN
jgi:hypothetical protein